MDYFCYISRSKIDQLFQTISPAEVDEWTESRTTEQNLNADIGADLSFAHIVSLFKSGITYGRKNLIQREKKIKIQYTEKLRTVLLTITKENPIQPISSAVETEHLSSMFYHHTGVFKIT